MDSFSDRAAQVAANLRAESDTRRWTISHEPDAGALRVTGPDIGFGSVEVMPVREHERIYAEAHHAHVQAFKMQTEANAGGTMNLDRVEEILKGMCGIGDAPPLVLADPALGLLIEHAEPHGNIELHRNGETWTVSYHLAKRSHPPTLQSTRRSLGDACRDVLTMARETL